MNYSCDKFNDFTFSSRFSFIMQTNTQTHRITESHTDTLIALLKLRVSHNMY